MLRDDKHTVVMNPNGDRIGIDCNVEVKFLSDMKKYVKAVAKVDGQTFEAQASCFEGDDFAFPTGSAIAYMRLMEKIYNWCEGVRQNEIQVGDIVKIAEAGRIFPSYVDFFEYNHLPTKMAGRFAYGKFSDSINCNLDYKVIAIGQHQNYDRVKICVIEEADTFNSPTYLINMAGLVKKESALFDLSGQIKACGLNRFESGQGQS